MKKEYVRCTFWKDGCSGNPECYHRLPHLPIEECDPPCSVKDFAVCDPGSFEKGEKYEILGCKVIVTVTKGQYPDRVIGLSSTGSDVLTLLISESRLVALLQMVKDESITLCTTG